MAGFIQFLSDMMGTKAEHRQTQQRFTQNPDAVMKEYGLSDEEQTAIKKRDFDKMGQHVVRQLKSATPEKSDANFHPNW